MMNSEEVNRTANAIAAAEAELQELPLRDRTRRIQSAIAAQTTMIGATVPMMTEAPATPTLFVSNIPLEMTQDAIEKLFHEFAGYRGVRLVPGREGIAFIDFDNEFGASAARGNSDLNDKIHKTSLFFSDALNGFKVSATNAISVRLN